MRTMKWSSTLDTIVFLSGATMKTTSQTVSLEVPTEQVGHQLGALDLLRMEDESLSVSQTREGFGWDRLHL